MYNSTMLDELDNPDNYRQFFKDSCQICGEHLPQMSSHWIHYKFFGNFCIKCDRKIGRQLSRKNMITDIKTISELHSQQMGRLFNLIMGQDKLEAEKERIIDDKIRDEIRDNQDED